MRSRSIDAAGDHGRGLLGLGVGNHRVKTGAVEQLTLGAWSRTLRPSTRCSKNKWV